MCEHLNVIQNSWLLTDCCVGSKSSADEGEDCLENFSVDQKNYHCDAGDNNDPHDHVELANELKRPPSIAHLNQVGAIRDCQRGKAGEPHDRDFVPLTIGSSVESPREIRC